MIKIVLILLITLCGGFVQRVCGFGFGIFVMIFLPYIIPEHTAAAAISTLVSLIMAVYNAYTYRKYIPYKKILPINIGALVTIPVAVHFSVLISGNFFKQLLGIVLVILSIYFLFFNNRIKIKPTAVNGLAAGGVGGVLSGLFSTGGPPIVLYLMNAFTDKNIYFASAQFYFSITGLYSTTVRALSGIITREVLIYSAIGFFGSIVGNRIGKSVFDKLNAERLRLVVYVGMLASGIIMVI